MWRRCSTTAISAVQLLSCSVLPLHGLSGLGGLRLRRVRESVGEGRRLTALLGRELLCRDGRLALLVELLAGNALVQLALLEALLGDALLKALLGYALLSDTLLSNALLAGDLLALLGKTLLLDALHALSGNSLGGLASDTLLDSSNTAGDALLRNLLALPDDTTLLLARREGVLGLIRVLLRQRVLRLVDVLLGQRVLGLVDVLLGKRVLRLAGVLLGQGALRLLRVLGGEGGALLLLRGVLTRKAGGTSSTSRSGAGASGGASASTSLLASRVHTLLAGRGVTATRDNANDLGRTGVSSIVPLAYRSPASGTASIFFTTSHPPTTRPNTTCLPFRNSDSASVMKNWHPFVLGPWFAWRQRVGPGDSPSTPVPWRCEGR